MDRFRNITARTSRRPGRLILAVPVVFALSMATVASAAGAETENVRVQQGLSAYRAGAFKAARGIFETLAKKNNPEATYWLGRMYEEGVGVAKNTKRAIGNYRAAARGGWRGAELRLGEIYLHGTEELQDFSEAHKWLERAALDGNSTAQRELGTLYANGWGAPKDPVLAYVWFEIAARQGDSEAPKLRDSVLKGMAETQIAKAQELTRTIASQVFGYAVAPSNGDEHKPQAAASGIGASERLDHWTTIASANLPPTITAR